MYYATNQRLLPGLHGSQSMSHQNGSSFNRTHQLTTKQNTRFAEMSFEQWQETVSPKMAGSWNLRDLLPKGMDFFVLFSSAVGIFGNVGQSNYAAGNTYQDALAHFRISQGEKATAIDLGAMKGAGSIAENTNILDHFQQLGVMLLLSLEEIYALLDLYCDPLLEPSVQARGQLITGIDIPSNIIGKGRTIPSCLYEPMFLPLHSLHTAETSFQNSHKQAFDYKQLFAASSTLIDAGLLVSDALRKKLSTTLGIPEENMELKNRVESYGVDSLVAVELRNWLTREFGADLAVFETIGGTLTAVGLTVAAKSSFAHAEWTNTAK